MLRVRIKNHARAKLNSNLKKNPKIDITSLLKVGKFGLLFAMFKYETGYFPIDISAPA